jgi:hypothetical protein
LQTKKSGLQGGVSAPLFSAPDKDKITLKCRGQHVWVYAFWPWIKGLSTTIKRDAASHFVAKGISDASISLRILVILSSIYRQS